MEVDESGMRKYAQKLNSYNYDTQTIMQTHTDTELPCQQEADDGRRTALQ